MMRSKKLLMLLLLGIIRATNSIDTDNVSCLLTISKFEKQLPNGQSVVITVQHNRNLWFSCRLQNSKLDLIRRSRG